MLTVSILPQGWTGKQVALPYLLKSPNSKSSPHPSTLMSSCRPEVAAKLAKALQVRKVKKRYIAIVHGSLDKKCVVTSPLEEDVDGKAWFKMRLGNKGGQAAETIVIPMITTKDFTMVMVQPLTGRKHQIRVHCESLGHPLVGDKMYGMQSQQGQAYIDFVEHGWSDRLEAQLLLRRQALHCAEMVFYNSKDPSEGMEESIMYSFHTPSFPKDMLLFCLNSMKIEKESLMLAMQRHGFEHISLPS
eukprot:m.96011 g.96011  ORF g.96011 m.96011 type:complete len:245 (+) comp13525_c0_seq1:1635-2369(+)